MYRLQCVQGNGNFYQIPKGTCFQILRSVFRIDHLIHLDVSGNNLTGYMYNLVSDSDSGLPLLERLYLENTTITSDDINHLIHIIETGKLPNLEMLNLDRNDFGGMEAEIDRLLNVAIAFHQRELEVRLPGDSF